MINSRNTYTVVVLLLRGPKHPSKLPSPGSYDVKKSGSFSTHEAYLSRILTISLNPGLFFGLPDQHRLINSPNALGHDSGNGGRAFCITKTESYKSIKCACYLYIITCT